MDLNKLKQEAKEYADKYGKSNFDIWDTARFAYYQSAEPREKQIAELEQKLEQTEKDLADYQFNYPTIKELQKENAELKGLVNQYKASRCGSISLVNRNMIMFDQLTKAKELLRDLIKFQPYIDKEAMFLSIGNEWKTVIYKAEQFLNSEVKK